MKVINITVSIIFLLAGIGSQAQPAKQIYVKEAGTLKEQLTPEDTKNLKSIQLTGNINAKDFKTMRDELPVLEQVDLTAASIRMYMGKDGTFPKDVYVYPKDCVPAHAFKGNQSLKKIVLSPAIRNLEDCAFQECNNLKIIQIKKPKAPNLLPYALEGITAAIFIPLGSKGEYRSKEKWAEFNFVEGEPVEVTVSVAKAGTLGDEISKSGYRPEEISILTISGSLGDEDFKYIQDRLINLVNIDMSNCMATKIPAFAFTQRKYLMWVKLPQQLTAIGDRAFSGCTWLSGEITLPASVEEIGYGAFLGCDKLEKVTCQGQKPARLGENIFGSGSKAVLE